MTRTQFAQKLIKDNIYPHEGESRKQALRRVLKTGVSNSDLLKSSNLCVGAEYLNLINDEDMKEYVKSRDGIQMIVGDEYNSKASVLSARDMLNALSQL